MKKDMRLNFHLELELPEELWIKLFEGDEALSKQVSNMIVNEAQKEFHRKSFHNREAVLNSKECGCFYCLKTFKPEKIKEWGDGGNTALCPKCGVDSVMPEGFFGEGILKEMNSVWFSRIDKIVE